MSEKVEEKLPPEGHIDDNDNAGSFTMKERENIGKAIVGHYISGIQNTLGNGHRVVIIARSLDPSNSDIVVGTDPDLEASYAAFGKAIRKPKFIMPKIKL